MRIVSTPLRKSARNCEHALAKAITEMAEMIP
ncbi:hypothetical protein Cassandra_0334 [Pseudomonas phage Cassandra]|nr:hypothetical protein Cassandra_0334 [Pseudomonas phage Cassandra]